MKDRGRRREARRHRVKPSELAGFLILGLFVTFVVYLIIPPQMSQTTSPTSVVGTSTSPSQSSVAEPRLKAALVDQLSVHSPNPDFVKMAEYTMRAAGFAVDIYGPEKVTVSLYAALPTHGYRLIVLRVHAGVNEEMEGRPVGLFTTEVYSEFKYPQEQLNDQVGSAQALNRPEVVFAVTPRFIREKSVMDYGGAIVVLTGCFGVYSQDLPSAFIDRGASIIIGWTGLVSVKHTDEATLALLRMMLLDKMTVEDSVRAVMDVVGPDPDNGSVLGYYPQDRGTLTLPGLVRANAAYIKRLFLNFPYSNMMSQLSVDATTGSSLLTNQLRVGSHRVEPEHVSRNG